MKVAYAKLGRSVLLDPEKWGKVGGDNEPLHLLRTLAERNPNVEWVIAGRNSGDPGGLPRNVTVPIMPDSKYGPEWDAACAQLYADADGAVVWLGQHGTSNMPIPMDKDPYEDTNPQEWSRRYAGPIIKGLNLADDKYEPVWLCADPRNYLKARDLKWYPSPEAPILGQFDWAREQRHYRFDDWRTPEEFSARARNSKESLWSKPTLRHKVEESNFWKTKHKYIYSGLELTGVPRWEDQDWPSWEERSHFGIVINEARAYVNAKKQRAPIVREWVNPLRPAFFHGTWSDDGKELIGRDDVEPLHYLHLPSLMSTTKSTFTTPSSGSEWATAKWWESAALGVACFIHPYHDTQGHIIPLKKRGMTARDQLAEWLRPKTPQDLWARVKMVHEDKTVYEWIRDAQRAVLAEEREKNMAVNLIETRLGLQ